MFKTNRSVILVEVDEILKEHNAISRITATYCTVIEVLQLIVHKLQYISFKPLSLTAGWLTYDNFLNFK